MEVEGIHLPSDDTLEGVRVHRRVDSPSSTGDKTSRRADAATDGDRPKAVRSLTLTSPARGLTATLDLAEISGKSAVPIEYRKGRPYHVRPSAEEEDDNELDGAATVEPWPTDRIQVGFQAILLEDAGYTVPHGILYYAAEKRRVTVPIDDALRREALDTLAAARACAAGPRPLPLVNDRPIRWAGARCAGWSHPVPPRPRLVRNRRPGAAFEAHPPTNVGGSPMLSRGRR